jgi:RNA polymerase sigma factor (TIGR02999 family)
MDLSFRCRQLARYTVIIAVMADITRILSRIESGDASAAEQLLPLVYDELRKLAASRLYQEKPGHTLQATALVHDAYLRLVDQSDPPRWQSRGHFFASAAEAMRRILVECARRKQREKHGGLRQRVALPEEGVADTPRDEQLILLDEALSRLKTVRPQAAQIVELRYFGGQTAEEAAAIAGVSERTARRLWVFAQAWLRREMENLDESKPLTDK